MNYNFQQKRYYKVSFITPCMGRLFHLKETLIKNLEHNRGYSNLEYVLLDYNSPDGLEEWVRKNLKRYIDQGVLVYYKTFEPQFFHMSHAKNIGHLLATGDIVVNVDADNFVGHGYAEHLNDMFLETPRSYCRCSRNGDDGSGGRVAIMRDEFVLLGGYEEKMVGWGYEDADLVARARRNHIRGAFTNSVWCKAIQHDDASRERYQTPPTRISLLKKKESTDVNFQIFEHNRRHHVVLANENRVWGKARVVRNFLRPFEISSEIVLKGPPKEIVLPPTEVVRPPLVKPIESRRARAVGYFSVAGKLRVKAEPHPEMQKPVKKESVD